VWSVAFGSTECFAGCSCYTRHNLPHVRDVILLIFTKTAVCCLTLDVVCSGMYVSGVTYCIHVLS